MTPVIIVERVYKEYQLFTGMKLRTFTQELGKVLRFTRQTLTQQRPASRYVLSDVSFSMNAGDSLGIIGHNGSGKSTLLRLLAGVSLPTKGRVRVVGRLSPMLSLGAGFHHEMTGYENLYLNCTLMGLNYQQTRTRIEQIVEFADIGDYIDVAVKRYSSGMLARLGFAAAIHMDPEIILLDEVLAVGDYAFVTKSMAAIRTFIERGTVILVSHDLSAIERICHRTLWLDQGGVRGYGASTDVIYDYTQAQQQKLMEERAGEIAAPTVFPAVAIPAEPAPALAMTAAPVAADLPLHAELSAGAGLPPEPVVSAPVAPVESDRHRVTREQFDPNVVIESVTLHDHAGNPCDEFAIGDEIVVRCQVNFTRPMNHVRFVVGLVDVGYQAVVTAADNQQISEPAAYHGRLVLEARFPDLKLRPRGFGVWLGISNPAALLPLATWKDTLPRCFVTGSRRDPALHYYAPQGDIFYTPGVSMEYLTVNDSTPVKLSSV